MQKILYFTITLFLAVTALSGQNNWIGYRSKIYTQSYQMNAAFIPELKTVVSFPLFSSFHINTASTASPSDVLVTRDDGAVILDISYLADQLEERNKFSSTINYNLFNIGTRIGDDGFFSIGTKMHLTGHSDFSDELIGLIGKGNAHLIGQDIYLNDEQLYINNYLSVFAGYSHQISDQWSVGGRVQVLQGLNYASMDAFEASLFTDETSAYTTTAEVSIEATANGFLAHIVDENTNSAKYSLRNLGGAIDLGLNYQYTPQLSFSLAINNLGVIKWSEEDGRLLNIATDGAVEIEGISINSTTETDNIGDQFSNYLDSLQNDFGYDLTTSENTTFLRPEIMLAGSYDLSDRQHFTLLYHAYPRFQSLAHSISALYQYDINNSLQLLSNLTWYETSPINLGLGIVAETGSAQLFIATNDVLTFLNKEEDRNNIDVSIGINIIMGREDYQRTFSKKEKSSKTQKKDTSLDFY